MLPAMQEALQDAGLRRPRVELLTSSTKAKARRQILEGLKDGSIDLVVGTHSIIADTVEYANLGLGIIDEQHRCEFLASDGARSHAPTAC